jgi:hypothetical protein
MISPSCLCVCLPVCLSPCQLLNKSVDFIKFYREYVPLVTSISRFKPVDLAILKLLRSLKNFGESTRDREMLYSGRFWRMDTFNKTISVKDQKYENGEWLNFKIHILFSEDNS